MTFKRRSAIIDSVNEERKEFEERGFVVLRNVVSAQHLTEMKRAFSGLIDPWRAQMRQQPRRVWQIPLVAGQHPALLAHFDSTLVARLSALVRAETLRILQHTLILKEPGEHGEIRLHNDHRYVGFLTPPNVMSVRLALEPERMNNGAMWVIEGSHRWDLDLEVEAFTDELADLERGLNEETRQKIEAHKVHLELEPGDISVHHCLTLHGSESSAENTRRTVVAHIFDASCTVATERLPPGSEQWIQPDHAGRLASDMTPQLPLSTTTS